MCVDYTGVLDVTGFFEKKKFGLVILLLVEMFPGIVNNVLAVIKYFPQGVVYFKNCSESLNFLPPCFELHSS